MADQTAANRAAVPVYSALALQTDCHAVNGKSKADAHARMLTTIAGLKGEIASAIGFTKGFNGTDTRLVVLPEYFLSSFPMGEPIAKWQEIGCVEMAGAEYDALGAIAQAHKCYLSGNVYEIDPKFPQLYFQCCFLIAPSGNVILRYRRLISLFAPSPFDVWDKYLDAYGLDGVFPVAKTEIGNIACVASEEILYPELTRAHVLRGAEIICHSTSEVGAPLLTPKEICRRARAVENMCYVVSANTARIVGTPLPPESTGGMSKVVDYKGAVLAEAYPGATFTANAILDIEALRKYRALPGMCNVVSRQPLELYAASYAGRTISPANTFVADGAVTVPDRAFFVRRQQAVIDRIRADGLI
ncbi:MAG: nitrilase-related carbon-nitrogen hydrolase [Rhodospirillaceae bacterium]|nr:nitrilase-related carbon-nitrogen hydrolase [Rhodospirillaceae bacterium]